MKLKPIGTMMYSAILMDSFMLDSDLSTLSSPMYLLTRVEQACPTPRAGMKDVCMIVKSSSVVASSINPIIPTIL